ncbi:DUF2726 domain-containing protein [Amorphus sp. 3PC139-8]|uniref:DUF2726 domain-containing protein n=1 Tax=Amorphus sp. 3PC139-8 TaxID=2735676 RepID=UPI00345D34A9
MLEFVPELEMSVPFLALILAIVASSAALLSTRRMITAALARRAVSYSYRPVMTKSEFSFHLKLSSALHDCDVWPRVAMNSLVKKERGRAPIGSEERDVWAGIHVDWVIARNGRPFAVVVLDDRTQHLAAAKARAEYRDEILSRAGYRVVRFAGAHQDREQIRRRVIPAAVRPVRQTATKSGSQERRSNTIAGRERDGRSSDEAIEGRDVW